MVTHGILNQQTYMLFLFLHAAIRILISKSPSKAHLSFADLALKKFVERCKDFYGPIFYSYNVHGLIHITNDVQQLGPLDSFSAFPYENNMVIFRKYCRKPNLPLQQIYNRLAEIEAHSTIENYRINSNIHVSVEHNAGPLPCNLISNFLQYRKITFNGILLTLNMRDNCCILYDMSICIVVNIVMIENLYYLVVKKFREVKNFYDVGIPSSALHIFKCSSLTNNIFTVSIVEVRLKGYRMPLLDSTSVEVSSSDDENHPEISHFLVAGIVHNE
jgi:hypothetical protein